LTPHADLLFDRGWISFEDKGQLIVTSELPADVRTKIGLKLRQGRNCGLFTTRQQSYLKFHREKVFEQHYKATVDPLEDLLADMAAS
jgi:hypothetical protein